MQQQTIEEIRDLVGGTLVDGSGDKVGKVDDIYLDQDTRKPEWALVHTGFFGSKQAFVPLEGADMSGDTIRVRFAKDQIKDAPHAEPDGELSQDEEQRLYRHYGLQYSEAPSDSGLPTGGAPTGGTTDTGTTGTGTGTGGEVGGPGHDTSGPNTDSAMTRSEEELRVGTTRRPSELVRLKKYVVTEDVQTTVPVQREEVRVEREPITDANVGQATDGPAISEEEHEVTLMEEEVVVDKRAVPKERVRLDKDVVTEERTVSDEVRKEQIEVDQGRDGR
jgi:uncharacterized protein (TIGR02271 family)